MPTSTLGWRKLCAPHLCQRRWAASRSRRAFTSCMILIGYFEGIPVATGHRLEAAATAARWPRPSAFRSTNERPTIPACRVSHARLAAGNSPGVVFAFVRNWRPSINCWPAKRWPSTWTTPRSRRRHEEHRPAVGPRAKIGRSVRAGLAAEAGLNIRPTKICGDSTKHGRRRRSPTTGSGCRPTIRKAGLPA